MFPSNDSTFSIPISQKRQRAFDFEPNVDFEPTFNYPKGQSTFKFKSNVAKWTATIPSTSPWLTFGEEKANEITGERTDVTLQLNFDKSEEETAREAIITVRANSEFTPAGKDSSFQIKVTQNRGRAFEFDSDFEFYRPLFFTEDDTIFKFQSNVANWKAESSNPSWLTVETKSGDRGDMTLRISHTRNTSELKSRTATITVTATTTESEDSTFVIEVEQYVKGTFLNNEGKKIKFAPGNLQYCATQNKWRFAEHQYDRCGAGGAESTVYWNDNGTQRKCDNRQMSATYGGWIDMFKWCATGQSDGVAPYASPGVAYMSKFSEWGQNIIGDYPANTWRTIDEKELKAILAKKANQGATPSYIFVLVESDSNDPIAGILLLPNEFTWKKAGVEDIFGAINNSLPRNINLTYLNALEAAGCVFLPGNSENYSNEIDKYTTYWVYGKPSWNPAPFTVRFNFYYNLGQNYATSAASNLGPKNSVRLIRDLE